MPFEPVHVPDPLLLSPPLLPPLALRGPSGLYGQKRRNGEEWGQCDPCTRFEPPPPNMPKDYIASTIHEAVDIDAAAGDCVFAAYIGEVVDVATSGGGTKGNVTIDHHRTLGLVTRYLHLDGNSICVAVGQTVKKGELIGHVGSGPAEPHLHFELRMVVDPAAPQFWGDRTTVPLDPTRPLYRSDGFVEAPVTGSASGVIDELRVGTDDGFPFLVALIGADQYRVPLWEPMTATELELAASLRAAHGAGATITLTYRESDFFGSHQIVTGVGF